MSYQKWLLDGYKALQTLGYASSPPSSRLEYLGNDIFDFTTYDGVMSAAFAEKAVEVCKAITEHATFEYIKDEDNYRWYLLMVNMPFFASRIDWGTSIRGAFWDNEITFQSCGLWDGEKQLHEELAFTLETWEQFMRDVVAFAQVSVPTSSTQERSPA